MSFKPGQLYRAIDEKELIELEPPQFKGLKLLILPCNMKGLKKLQKSLEKRLGRRPDLAMVVNAILLDAIAGRDPVTYAADLERQVALAEIGTFLF